MTNDQYHVPVLLKEVIEYLNVKPGKKYIDCTFGGGGHTTEILKKGGIVLGIDQDPEAIKNAQEKWEMGNGKLDKEVGNGKVVLRHENFAHLKKIATEAEFDSVSGILFDLGVSSHQLGTDYRGFSFKRSLLLKLDMRMDPENQAVTAADLVNAGSEKDLADLFWKFGEEQDARKIAREIVRRRAGKQIGTTDELVKIILSVSKRSQRDRTHPATRVFQALRIAVNDELTNLQEALPQVAELLETGGRLVVISFHSLEDRIVKNFMRMNTNVLRILTNKPITPNDKEIKINPRARSGKMRVAQKI